MVTPFDMNGDVDYSEAERLATYLVDVQQNDGLVINGTTGESPTLSEEEKLKLLKVVLDTVGNRAAVLFGAGTYNTQESISYTRAAEKIGAHGIMLVSPYYSRPGQSGLYAHFKTVAAETGLPVLLYNIQPRTSINIETPTLVRLAEIPNIVGVKEASGSMAQISDVCAQAPDGFRVYSGDDGLTLPLLSVGGYGIISVTAHAVGSEIKALVNAFLAKDTAEATRLHKRLLPFTKAAFCAPNPVPIKYALSLLGQGAPTVRLPLVELTDDEKALVKKSLAVHHPNL